MSKTVFYVGCCPFTYYLVDVLTCEPFLVSEKEFFNVVGYNRKLVPMHYDKDNINRQNFYFNGMLVGYRTR